MVMKALRRVWSSRCEFCARVCDGCDWSDFGHGGSRTVVRLKETIELWLLYGFQLTALERLNIECGARIVVFYFIFFC